jgi:hypothetical protein
MTFFAMDSGGVGLIACIVSGPVQAKGRIILEAIKPTTDKAIAALELVVEEPERKVVIHRLDPERETGKPNGERIEIHAIEAAFDDETLEPGTDCSFSGRKVARQVAHTLAEPGWLACGQAYPRAEGTSRLFGHKPLVMEQAAPECFGNVTKNRDGE